MCVCYILLFQDNFNNHEGMVFGPSIEILLIFFWCARDMKAFGGNLHRGGGGEVAHSGKVWGVFTSSCADSTCRC